MQARFAAISATLLALTIVAPPATAQTAPSPAAVAAAPGGTILLTIFLKHDQSKPLGEINEALKKNGYYQRFPPQGVEIVSWYVMMGIGQVVTLRFPAERLREVNRVIEETAWGPYRTEFYPTYDYKPIAEQERAKAP
jgi:hypothetical protein